MKENCPAVSQRGGDSSNNLAIYNAAAYNGLARVQKVPMWGNTYVQYMNYNGMNIHLE